MKSLAPAKADIVLAPRASLSAFFETALQDILRDKKIAHLVVAGAAGNLGLDSTVRDGVQAGFHITVLEDCVATISEPEARAVAVTMPRYAQTIMTLAKFETLVTR